MSSEDNRQAVLVATFRPYKVLFFEVDGFRAERFLANPTPFDDFDAIFLGLAYPEDNPENFTLLAQFIQKAGGRPIFVMPAYDNAEIARLSVEHGATAAFLIGQDDTEYQNGIDQAKLLMEKSRSLPRS